MTTEPRVFIVEDNNIIVMELEGRLEDLGYIPAGHATNGADAVAEVARLRPDLVLMDIRLRGPMDGIAAARRIRSETGIPIIYLTAHADKKTLERAKLAEPFGYLIKPFDERELHSAIEVALYKHGMEQKLQESRQWLTTILKSIGDAVIATDTAGNVSFLNDPAIALTGWDQESALGRALPDVLRIRQDHTTTTIEELVRQAKLALGSKRGKSNTKEVWLTAIDGSTAPIEYTIAPIQQHNGMAMVLVFRDITKRRRAEREVAHRLAQSQTLRDVMLAAASTLDFDQVLERTMATLQAEMGIEFISYVMPGDTAETLTLHRSQIGFDLSPGDIRIPLDRSVSGRALSTGEAVLLRDVTSCPFYFAGAPGIQSELAVPVWVNGTVHGVLDLESRGPGAFDEDALSFYTAIAGQLSIALQNAHLYHHATQRAQELSEALDSLQELDDLKSEFIQNVSHELRMPITLIKGYSALLAEGELGELSESQQRAADVVSRRADMMCNLVEDILLILLTEHKEPEIEAVPIVQLAESAVEDFKLRAAEADLNLVADIERDIGPAAGVAAHLQRVLDNLLGNAVKFTRANGTITLRLKQRDEGIVLQVSDTGIGIPPEEQARIFDRFYQVDGSAQRRYGGAGLGLALVKEVVEACGGSVRVDSESNVGTTFTVTLQSYR
jgi:PAS domain S-box-containing protein